MTLEGISMNKTNRSPQLPRPGVVSPGTASGFSPHPSDVEARRLAVAEDGIAWLSGFGSVSASIVDVCLKAAVKVGGGQPLATALSELHEFAVKHRHVPGARGVINAIERLETPALAVPFVCATCGRDEMHGAVRVRTSDTCRACQEDDRMEERA